MTLILILVFVFGTIIGSFLNVVIYRFNTGRSMMNDRSGCFSCGKTLAWYELIPVFSFVAQGGKCRSCKARISWQYPLVELLTGIVFVGITWKFPFIDQSTLAFIGPILVLDIFYALIWCMLVVILVYDFRHKIIPNNLAYSFAVLSFIKLFVAVTASGFAFQIPVLADMLAGILLFLPFYLLWLVSQGRWIGLGDGKLALGIGWFLGLAQGGTAILFAFWIGALVGVTLIALNYLSQLRTAKGFKKVFHSLALYLGLGERIMKSELPFAPFLIIGMALVFFFNFHIPELVLGFS